FRRVLFRSDLADVAGHFRHALLAVVEFLEHHHGQEDVVFLEAEYGAGIVHEHVGVKDEQAGLLAFAPCFGHWNLPQELRKSWRYKDLIASSTSSTCPLTFTPRHSRRSTPSSPMRNVLRTMPSTFLPYMFFSWITSNSLQTFSSASLSRSKGNSCFALKFSWDLRLSREMPKTRVLRARNLRWLSRKFCPSVVQPGVLSLG